MADENIDSSIAALATEVVDLTDDTSAQPKDHMSTIAEMIRQEHRQSSTTSLGNSNRKARMTASDSTKAPLPATSSPRQQEIPSASGSRGSLHDGGRVIQEQPLDNFIDLSDSEEASITDIRSKRPKKSKTPTFHKFLELPPEIRNKIYRLLLTTPGIPIELPRLTGPEGRRREAAWAESVVLYVHVML